jgi:GTP-binding protein
VLDLAPLDGSDPAANFALIERELAEHDPRLAALPRLLALSKADLVPPEAAEAAAAQWRARVEFPVLVTSSATGAGLLELRNELLGRVPVAEAPAEGTGEDEVAEFAVFRPGASKAFEIARADSGEWVVSGEAVERLIARHDLENDEALSLVERRLQRMGVIAALERAGFEPGDDVEIGGTVFELDPSSPL